MLGETHAYHIASIEPYKKATLLAPTQSIHQTTVTFVTSLAMKLPEGRRSAAMSCIGAQSFDYYGPSPRFKLVAYSHKTLYLS